MSIEWLFPLILILVLVFLVLVNWTAFQILISTCLMISEKRAIKKSLQQDIEDLTNAKEDLTNAKEDGDSNA